MSDFKYFNIKLMLDQEPLSARGHNFVAWATTLRMVLRNLEWMHVLDAPLPCPLPHHDMNGKPVKEFTNEEIVRTLMVSTMDKELSDHLETGRPFEMMSDLMMMFHNQVRVEHYKITKAILNCKIEEGGSMLSHEINLVTLMKRLEDWGFPMSLEYNTDVILASLPPSYNGFIACYLMLGVKEPVRKLFAMLKAVGDGMLMLDAPNVIPDYTPESPEKV
jgi:hypothetical protein